MRSPLVSAALVLLVCALPAQANYLIQELGQGQHDADRPAMAHSPAGAWPDGDTQVAWVEEGVGIWTQYLPTFPLSGEVLPPPVFHGAGDGVVLAWTWRGFLLAWIDGGVLKLHYGWGRDWPDPPLTVATDLDLSHSELALTGCARPGWDVAWLAFGVGDGLTADVWFLRVQKSSWDAPELLASAVYEPVGARVAETPHAPQPLPRVYYFGEIGRLTYRTQLPAGEWSPPENLPETIYGTEVDVCGRADGAQAVLSLGLQPTCPCNQIHFTLQSDEGAWLEPSWLTVHHDAYDWPHSPCIVWDQGNGHLGYAFWMQEGFDGTLAPTRNRLEFWVGQDQRVYPPGVRITWSDAGRFLGPYASVRGLGRRVAMALPSGSSLPALSWTRKDTLDGEPRPRRVWLARPHPVTGVAETLGDDAGLALSAWPNPGNPRFALAGRVPAGDAARLAVYDLAGRRLASLPLSLDDGGRFATRWSGCDDSGRQMPAGVYLLRLTAGDRAVTRRVVLAR